MTNSFIQIPADSTGKKVDTEQVVVAGNEVQRERDRIAGLAADELADVKNATPLASHYGLVVRQIPGQFPWVNIQTSHDTAVGITPEGTANLDSGQISTSKTGYLLGIHVSSSVPWKAVLQLMNDGIASADTLVWFSHDWREPIKPGTFSVVESAAPGLDGWRVVVTNLDAARNSDIYATFYWDEQ